MSEKTDLNIKERTCLNCGSANVDAYCSNCGQKVIEERNTLKKFFAIFFDAFNLDRGILHTFWYLFYKPGILVKDYLGGKTKPYFNPLNYLVIAAGLYAFVILKFDIFDSSLDAANNVLLGDALNADKEVLDAQMKFLSAFKSIINLIPLFLIPFAALVSKWTFRSSKLYYGEYLIINCYLFAQSFYLSLIPAILAIAIPGLKAYFGLILAAIEISFMSYAFYRIFKRSRLVSFLKTIVVFIGGMLLFYLALLLSLFAAAIIAGIFGANLMDLI